MYMQAYTNSVHTGYHKISNQFDVIIHYQAHIFWRITFMRCMSDATDAKTELTLVTLMMEAARPYKHW